MFAAGWAAEGRALPAADAPDGPCELCGHRGPRVKWRPPPNWTMFDTHAHPRAGAVCQGCSLLLTGGPRHDTPSGRPVRWMWHTLATNGRACEWHLKNETARIRRLVEDPGWSVAVVDAGRTHTMYLAPITRPGRVRVGVDGATVDLPVDEWQELAGVVEHARAAGVTVAALRRPPLSHAATRRLGVPTAVHANRVLSRHAATAALHLATLIVKPDKQEET